MKASFKMKKRPAPPKPHKDFECTCTWYEPTLDMLIKYCEERDIYPAKLTIDIEYDRYDESAEIRTCYHVPESKECFDKRMEKYQKRLADYEEWEKLFEKEIAEYTLRQTERRRIDAEYKNAMNDLARKKQEQMKKL